MTRSNFAGALAMALVISGALSSQAALAQEADPTPPIGPDAAVDDEATVFDDNWLSIGLGAGYGPSYDGSDDYVVFPLPVIQGKLGGVGISPRPAGLALDFIGDSDNGPSLSLGPVARIRTSRARQIEDPVVEAAGELDTAIEVGPTAGVSFPGVLNQYDSLSFTVDALWDVAGAHEGMVINPSVTYFTPLSRGIATSFSLSAEYADSDFRDYYYSVTPAQRLASGLPLFDADGGGFNKAGATLLLGVDLDGDLANGGLAAYVIGGYSRLLGDAKRSPYVSLRGDADQWLVGLGLGYTF